MVRRMGAREQVLRHGFRVFGHLRQSHQLAKMPARRRSGHIELRVGRALRVQGLRKCVYVDTQRQRIGLDHPVSLQLMQ